MKSQHKDVMEMEVDRKLVNGSPVVTTYVKGPPWWRSQRYILAYLLFGGMMNIFFQRVNLSVAIICMVNHTAISQHGQLNLSTSYLESAQPRVSGTVQPNSFQVDFKDTTTARYMIQRLNNSGQRAEEPKPSATPDQVILDYRVQEIRAGNTSSYMIGSNITSPCALKLTSDNEDGALVWDKQMQGILLGAVYWTYFLLQIPANLVVRRVAKRTIVLCSMTVMSATTMGIHVAALWSPWAVFMLRLVQGVCTALVIIAMYGMWSRWAPPRERSSLITLSMSGQTLGNIIVFPVSAMLCRYGFLGGWPSIFYIFGGIGFVWVILFFFLSNESPSTHQFICEEEKNYILSTLSIRSTDKLTVPWAAILKSVPFWGIVIGQFSFTWGLLLTLSTLPQYMLEVLKFDIKSNGIYSMLPYILLLISMQSAGGISDMVVRRKYLSVLWTRRACVLVANLTPAVLLTIMSFLDHTRAALAIVLLVISIGISGLALSGLLVNPYDIAPRFASEMMIIINTVATSPGVMAPYFVAVVTPDQTREQWQIVYLVTSGIYLVGALCFCLMSTGSVQSWARDGPVLVVHQLADDDENEDGDERDVKDTTETERGMIAVKS